MGRDPRPMKEWQLHAYTADLLRFQAWPDVLWFHIPNEGLRASRTGAFLKRLGMLPGVADFIVLINGRAHFLELKTRMGRLSATQRDFEKSCRKSRCDYAIARSPDEVRIILASWGAFPVSRSAAREAA